MGATGRLQPGSGRGPHPSGSPTSLCRGPAPPNTVAIRPMGAVTGPDVGYGKMSDWSLRTRADVTRSRRSWCEKVDEGGHPQGVPADRERL
jgi:hypothetical protein